MDNRGAAGFPMRLLLASVLVALCIPSLAGMVSGFEDQTETNLAEEQAHKIVSASADMYRRGTGNSAIISLDIPAGYEIHAGGKGMDSHSVRILNGSGIVSTQYTEHPVIDFIGSEISLSGHTELRISCVSENGTYGIRMCPL